MVCLGFLKNSYKRTRVCSKGCFAIQLVFFVKMIKAYYCTKNNFHCVKKASDNRQSRIIFQGINLYLILTGIFLTTIITQLLRQLD